MAKEENQQNIIIYNTVDGKASASLYRWYGKYDSAFAICDSIIQIAPQTEIAGHALSIWWDASRRAEMNNFIPVAEKIIESYPGLYVTGIALSILSDIYANQKEFDKAIVCLDQIVKLFPKTLLHKYALFDKINLAINEFRDIARVNTLLSELEKNFPGDELINDIQAILDIEKLDLNKHNQFYPQQQDSTLPSIAELFDLKNNYPNPFNPETEIRFQLPEDVHVTLSIFNLLGQKVRTIIDKQMATGYHTIKWDGRNDFGNSVASGVYLYFIQAGKFFDVKKMILMR